MSQSVCFTSSFEELAKVWQSGDLLAQDRHPLKAIETPAFTSLFYSSSFLIFKITSAARSLSRAVTQAVTELLLAQEG